MLPSRLLDDLLEFIRSITGLDTLSIDDDLLDSGAHSLTLVEALTDLEDRYGVVISSDDLGQGVTVRSLAALIVQSSDAVARAQTPEILGYDGEVGDDVPPSAI
jgi:acyl carrier protein